MFLIFKLIFKVVIIITTLSKMFHILIYGKVNSSHRKIFCEKLLDSMIDASLVFPFLKNSYRPASDMTCFIDMHLRVKRTEHK